MQLKDLTVATLAPLEGSTFLMTPVGETPFEVTLRAVTTGPSGPARDPFSLLFVGGPTPPAPQGIFTLGHDALGALDIFIVPLGPDAEGQRYEAVFS